MQISFSLFAIPRTKKTSFRILSFGRPCRLCHKQPFQKLAPSEQFEAFAKECYTQGQIIRDAIEQGGRLKLPIRERVSVKAMFFRDADTGDALGYYQALADVMQQPLYSVPCPNWECRTPKTKDSTSIRVTYEQIRNMTIVQCGRCGTKFKAIAFGAERSRDGLGIICDDVQITDWNGSELLVDAADPRIEITLTTIEGSLFE